MDWSTFEVERFVKILSLALSGRGNEALVALNKAVEMLERAGGSVHSLGDLIRGEVSLLTPVPKEPDAITNKKQPTMGQLLERMARADLRISELERENGVLTTQLDEAVRYIISLESDLTRLKRVSGGG